MLRKELFVFLLALSSATLHAQWYRRDLFDRIQLSGSRNVGLHFHTVEGDRAAFDSLNYYGQGNRRFTDIGNVEVVGNKVLGVLNFRATITDSHISDPQQQHVSLDYNEGPWKINLGDIWGTLNSTNTFAALNRSMRGAELQFKSGRLRISALQSFAKGSAKTISIQGNNSTGPYYLQSNQIVADSEKVLVDGEEQTRGDDYVINNEVGYITFTTRVISPTSVILVTYEAFAFNSNNGTIQGASSQLDLGKVGRLGVSLISQSTGAAGGLSTRLEKFEGFGAASTPYFLQFEPLLSRPITIKVNGILQVQGVDYVFDGANPSIFYFTRFMDPSQKIDVVYTPKPTQSVEGDRRVFGADYLLPVGRYGSLNYSIAKGELLSSVNPSSGIARNFAANLHWKKLVLRGHVNSIPQQFVSVENRSFNRNERATQLELGYDWRGLTSGLSHQNSAISIRRIDVNGTPFFQPGRTTLSKAFASRKVGGIDVSLSQTRTSSVSSQSDNQLDATALSASKRFGNVTFTSSMDHQTGYGLIPVGNILTRSNIRVDSVRLGADFSPRGPWTYSAKTSLSSISAGSQSGVGHDILFTGVYRGSGRLQSEITYADSDSGELATLGTFTTGQGLGYDGNGFSSGVSGVGFTGGATNQRLAQIHAAYKLNDRIDLDGRLMTSQSAGSVTSNTQRNSYGVGLEANLGGGNLASLSVDHSSTNFIGSLFKSNSTSLDFSISGFPGRWNYRLNTSLLLSGGNSSFAQNNYAFDASVTRFLSKKQSLSLSGSSGRTTGYYSQNDATASLTYQYQLWNNVALGASYRWRKVANLGQQNSGGAYRSNSFDLSLNFNFGR